MRHTWFVLTLAMVVVACGSKAKKPDTAPIAGRPEPARVVAPIDTTAWTWRRSGDLQTARIRHTATLLADGRVLVAGGESGDDNTWKAGETAEVWDPATGVWSPAGKLVERPYEHSATLLADGRVLVAGGYKLGDERYLTSAEIWDAKTNKWTATGSLAQARLGHAATRLADGRVMVVGGGDPEIWDPATGAWTVDGSIPSPQSPTATTLADGRVLVCGAPQYASESIAQIRATDGTWSQAGKNVARRYTHGAALLPDGRVLLAGGYEDGPGPLASAELWDPETAAWTDAGTMSAPRTSASTTALPDGQVVVAGGYSEQSGVVALATADRWSPATGAWEAIPPLADARLDHTGVTLPDGRVLVTGGTTSSDPWKRKLVASTEIWGP